MSAKCVRYGPCGREHSYDYQSEDCNSSTVTTPKGDYKEKRKLIFYKEEDKGWINHRHVARLVGAEGSHEAGTLCLLVPDRAATA